MSNNGEVFLFDGIAEAVLAAGAAVARYDSRFITHRRMRGITMPGMVTDAISVLEELTQHPAIDSARISALGISLGCQVAVEAAVELDWLRRLILIAPVAVDFAEHLLWLEVGRPLEWLHRNGFVSVTGMVDLGAVTWWGTFDPGMGGTVHIDRLAATLRRQAETTRRTLIDHGNADAPPEFWATRFEAEPSFTVAEHYTGMLSLHVGAEDWTTPPRQAYLMGSDVTVYPGLGHLMSPRREGEFTYGPIAAEVLANVVRVICE